MNNREFVVNGRTKEQLKLALDLLLLDEYGKENKVRGWYVDKKKGFVLSWMPNGGKATPFTNNMGQEKEISKEALLELLWEWKDSDEAKEVEFAENWEEDLDHDGSNSEGWKLYVDEWGHVRKNNVSLDHYSIAAFKRIYCWYGK